MAQVTVRVNGREYDLTCGDGEEPHLRELSQYVDAKITALRGAGANLSDAQLLLMAGIVIADELSEATEPARKAKDESQSASETMVNILETSSGRLEVIASRLESL
ncbi:MAG: cell division protein ZapA [Alphaproteobacteria bacterium]